MSSDYLTTDSSASVDASLTILEHFMVQLQHTLAHSIVQMQQSPKSHFSRLEALLVDYGYIPLTHDIQPTPPFQLTCSPYVPALPPPIATPTFDPTQLQGTNDVMLEVHVDDTTSANENISLMEISFHNPNSNTQLLVLKFYLWFRYSEKRVASPISLLNLLFKILIYVAPNDSKYHFVRQIVEDQDRTRLLLHRHPRIQPNYHRSSTSNSPISRRNYTPQNWRKSGLMESTRLL